MAAWSLVSVLALASAGLNVESLSPDSLCPPQEETQRAVAARLGRVELEGTWRATYVLVHRTRGDFVTLKLFDPSDTLKLERQLPVQSGSCAALSEIIALVLERFFLRPDELAEPAAPVAPSPAAPPERPAPEPVVTNEAVGVNVKPVAPSPEPVAPPVTPPVALESAPVARKTWASVELWASSAWLAPSLRLARDFGGSYRLSLGGGFDLSQHRASAFEGSATVRRLPLSLSGSALWQLDDALRVRGSVELLSVLELAETRDLAKSGSGRRLVPGLGARLGAEFFLQSPAQPFVELTAAWLMGFFAPAFEVGQREVLEPPALVLGLSLGLQTPF